MVVLKLSTNTERANTVIEAENICLWYGNFKALKNVNLKVERNTVVSLIGPSGCGKSTLLRCFNRMNDFVDSAKITGTIHLNGENLYGKNVNVAEIRRKTGMVFQKPNPFPASIRKNVSWGPTINGFRGNINELVEKSLRSAALWDEVKDKLDESGYSLSGGQQQRLCIARAIAMQPEVILMDEPCSALDPISTKKIEDLIISLKANYTIMIVTHNMQQAHRISDVTAFMYQGELIETGPTKKMFESPDNPLTLDYVNGRFG
jgi:phosphate transport system ATP-binding protein